MCISDQLAQHLVLRAPERWVARASGSGAWTTCTALTAAPQARPIRTACESALREQSEKSMPTRMDEGADMGRPGWETYDPV
jgi:hypothetical protein